MVKIRINKFLADGGGISRRKADSAVEEGRVSVNDRIIFEPGTFVDPGFDLVRLDGILVNPVQEKIYLMLNKPVSYLTTMHDPRGRKSVGVLVEGIYPRVFPVGRLDYNTSGLLIMTNDGELANMLTHPRFGVEKSYVAKIRGVPREGKLRLLRKGIKIDGRVTSPGKFEVLRTRLDRAWINVVISEGKYRQIRKMFSAIGHPVLKLRRTGMAGLDLGDLPTGRWRYLTKKEISLLKRTSLKTIEIG